MTVLGAVVFGGFLLLGVLWLLATAPASEIDLAPEHADRPEHVPAERVLAHAIGGTQRAE